jgi:choline dehydrogenase-like flavoprotein
MIMSRWLLSGRRPTRLCRRQPEVQPWRFGKQTRHWMRQILHLWNRHSVSHARERSDVSAAAGRLDALHGNATGESRLNSFDGAERFRSLASGSELPGGTKRSRRSQAWCQRAREIGNGAALRPYAKREHAPANLSGLALEEYIRNGLVTFWHQSGTAKMGRDAMSVVDSELKVYGVEGLRVADASILPRVTTGNTMAPCVIIGERAAELLLKESLAK